MILLPVIAISVGFAVVDAVALNKIRNMPIGNIDLTKVRDGTYEGEAKAGNYIYKVNVEVNNPNA